jgi:hypothetical protein
MAKTNWQRIKIEVPEELSSSERVALADDIIEYIKSRTESGYDKNDKPFPKYSAGYAGGYVWRNGKKVKVEPSFAFRVAGKKKTPVNLTLLGDMLEALTLVKHKDGEIEIGYTDKEENGKAEGNILGTYGQPRPIHGKKRDFLGIDPDKVDELAEQYL